MEKTIGVLLFRNQGKRATDHSVNTGARRFYAASPKACAALASRNTKAMTQGW
jgi:hypothetical protein